jgi:hypothetical protein
VSSLTSEFRCGAQPAFYRRLQSRRIGRPRTITGHGTGPIRGRRSGGGPAHALISPTVFVFRRKDLAAERCGCNAKQSNFRLSAKYVTAWASLSNVPKAHPLPRRSSADIVARHAARLANFANCPCRDGRTCSNDFVPQTDARAFTLSHVGAERIPTIYSVREAVEGAGFDHQTRHDPKAARKLPVRARVSAVPRQFPPLGACVSIDSGSTADLPHNFDLTFDNCHTFWSCRVIWRNKNGGRVGVTWKNG